MSIPLYASLFLNYINDDTNDGSPIPRLPVGRISPFAFQSGGFSLRRFSRLWISRSVCQLVI